MTSRHDAALHLSRPSNEKTVARSNGIKHSILSHSIALVATAAAVGILPLAQGEVAQAASDCHFEVSGRAVMESGASIATGIRGSHTDGVVEVEARTTSNGRTFTINGATDRELSDVTIMATAGAGSSFDVAAILRGARVASPSASTTVSGYQVGADGVLEPVVTADGKTASLRVLRMPAGSSVSVELPTRAARSGAAVTVDAVMIGQPEGCQATPAPLQTGVVLTPPQDRPAPEAARPAASVKTVTRTFQVTTYQPRTAAQARALARVDDDRRLTYGEHRSLAAVGRTRTVTVRVPAQATSAQLLRAVNAATAKRGGALTNTAQMSSVRPGIDQTVAWELGGGANAKQPFGAQKRTAAVYLGRG